MRRTAFTLTEVLIVISIVILLAGLSFPVFQSAKKAAMRSQCTSNLRQLGVGITLYRAENDGAEYGTSHAMGIPPDLSLIHGALSLQCRGSNPNSSGYVIVYPISSSDTTAQQARWSNYVQLVGSSAVIIYDENHQDSFPRSLTWQTWNAIGLRLDGSVTFRRRMGAPRGYYWWHPEVIR